MKYLSVLVLLTALATFAGDAKPAPVDKVYDLTDITLPNWQPPAAPKSKVRGVSTFIGYQMPPTMTNMLQDIPRWVEPAYWDEALGTKITEQPGQRVLVRQFPAVHEKILALLRAIRQASLAPPGTVTPAPARESLSKQDPVEQELRKNEVRVERDTRIYTLARNSLDTETIQAGVPHEDWKDPAGSVDCLTTKAGCILVVHQTKRLHDLLRPYLAKLPKEK